MHEMGSQVWVASRISEARRMAENVRREARELTDPFVVEAAQQMAADLDAFADRYEAKLGEVSGKTMRLE